MIRIVPVLFAAVLAGCGQGTPSKFFADFNAELLLKKTCSGENCRIEEVAKGTSESGGRTEKHFKYLVVSETAGAAGLMSAIMSEVKGALAGSTRGESQFKGNISSEFTYNYRSGGRGGFIKAIFVNVSGGVYVIVDLHETN